MKEIVVAVVDLILTIAMGVAILVFVGATFTAARAHEWDEATLWLLSVWWLMWIIDRKIRRLER